MSTISTFCPFHNHQLSGRQEQPVVPLNCTISTEIRLCLSLKNSLLVTITIFICCCLQRRLTQKKSNLFKWHFIVTRYRLFWWWWFAMEAAAQELTITRSWQPVSMKGGLKFKSRLPWRHQTLLHTKRLLKGLSVWRNNNIANHQNMRIKLLHT